MLTTFVCESIQYHHCVKDLPGIAGTFVPQLIPRPRRPNCSAGLDKIALSDSQTLYQVAHSREGGGSGVRVLEGGACCVGARGIVLEGHPARAQLPQAREVLARRTRMPHGPRLDQDVSEYRALDGPGNRR